MLIVFFFFLIYQPSYSELFYLPTGCNLLLDNLSDSTVSHGAVSQTNAGTSCLSAGHQTLCFTLSGVRFFSKAFWIYFGCDHRKLTLVPASPETRGSILCVQPPRLVSTKEIPSCGTLSAGQTCAGGTTALGSRHGQGDNGSSSVDQCGQIFRACRQKYFGQKPSDETVQEVGVHLPCVLVRYMFEFNF